MNAPAAALSPTQAASQVRRAQPSDLRAWNAYVMAHPDSSFFHRFEWGRVIGQTYGHEAVFLMAHAPAGDIKGILPLVHVRSPLFGRALISTAFTVGGGVLADDAAAESALIAAAQALGEERGVDYVELRGGSPAPGWQTKDATYAGFVADIAADEEQNLSSIPRKKRADVRKGIKAAQAGELAVTREGDVETFYALYAESVRNLGTPVLPRRLIENLGAAFGDDMDVALVRAAGTPVAGLVSFYHQGTVMPYYGGASPAARALHAYDYMYWAQMRHAAGRGCARFDFGRSKVGTGAYDYKRHWGFEPQPLAYHYYLVKADDVPDINPNNPKFRLLTSVWSKLPLSVANRLGPLIAGHLG
ncbi:FemAB family XrtA/PEP-CTERM system-associated protein [Aquisalinus flavus]|uniref:Peptidoglycan bridge formation protein FemAB n=1 Tax=Aquisalinus flavus TaxID=1526572 RepID=A0A8J2V4Q0_9PROT|nr:FemAB family XrtA/PEP-CTERM system-associated protein [Aquisalinus flavus]MBD0427191.1 FemAB family PEP-CTERM system-associated protein [Aquisalinus flavus]UNE47006.1 FemAB family PEP-CTERM system-associated protein [Aquisalinus flavus]GGC99066.1 peptidoglycan bridge formation protein FemAB [Aquisalinus flavus]